MDFNKYWFKPRTFGYGVSPKTWEGWVVTILFILYLIFLARFKEDTIKLVLYFIVGIVAMLLIAFPLTEGKLKWNWGKE